MHDETGKYIRIKKITPHQMIPYIYNACLSYSKNKSMVYNCIKVAEHVELVLKNCPRRTVMDVNGPSRRWQEERNFYSFQHLWELDKQLASADEEGDH
jgi:hypothetical protein